MSEDEIEGWFRKYTCPKCSARLKTDLSCPDCSYKYEKQEEWEK